MSRHLPRILGYLAFFLAAGVISFVATFPADRLDELVNRRLDLAGGGAFRVEGSRYRFPLSLAAERLTVAAGGRRIELGGAVVTPSVLSLAGRSPAWTVRLRGEWGEIPLSLVTGKAGPWRLSTQGGKVDLARHPALTAFPLSFEGKAAVSFSLAGVKGALEGASGRGELVVTQAAVGGKLLQAMGVDALRFSRLSLPLVLERGILSLREGRVEGDLIGTVSGTSRLAPAEPLRSSLEISLSLRPSAETMARTGPVLALLGGGAGGGVQALNLRLSGTWGSPSLGAGETVPPPRGRPGTGLRPGPGS
jgi:type II secretion system protein N